ncbi:hypothetical protein AB4Y86_09485 [Arthrobacter sp. 2YAF22_2]|uniref:hypothetical protein n=1 Tax=Arthrobacter sp. 2YAF22_2 TaxID=3233029 RepID=UPI003F91852F
MTEQILAPDAEPNSADARVDWPTPADDAAIDDPAIENLLSRLGSLSGLPVSAHGEVYAGLHDGLVEALNEDVAGQPAGDPRP